MSPLTKGAIHMELLVKRIMDLCSAINFQLDLQDQQLVYLFKQGGGGVNESK